LALVIAYSGSPARAGRGEYVERSFEHQPSFGTMRRPLRHELSAPGLLRRAPKQHSAHRRPQWRKGVRSGSALPGEASPRLRWGACESAAPASAAPFVSSDQHPVRAQCGCRWSHRALCCASSCRCSTACRWSTVSGA